MLLIPNKKYIQKIHKNDNFYENSQISVDQFNPPCEHAWKPAKFFQKKVSF